MNIRQKITLYLLLYIVLDSVTFAQVVEIPDPNLRKAIEIALDKPTDAPITVEEMALLTEFEAVGDYGTEITDLTGLEHATNLKWLSLWGNKITDISPLAELIHLTFLDLDLNGNIPDLSPLSGLTELRELNLWANNISDITPLSGLTALTGLDLDGNEIADISPLSKLPHLEWLILSSNAVSDLSPLSELTELGWLSLWFNNISDISPLEGLTGLTFLDLAVNAVVDIAPLANLTLLEELSLQGNDISDITPLGGLTNLMNLNLANNAISDITPLMELPALTHLYLVGNPIIDPSPLCDLLSLEQLDIVISCAGVDDPVLDTFLGDFDEDGDIDLSDLFLLLLVLFSVSDDGDFNGDGKTDLKDLVEVALVLKAVMEVFLVLKTEDVFPFAPSVAPVVTAVTSAMSVQTVEMWIDRAGRADDGSLAFQQGIANLKRFRQAIRPEQTALLPNYPNPFNPETWIPYLLTESAVVRLTIYDTHGTVVRRFDLGFQPAGHYTDRAKAVYWDGRNDNGQPVVSGVYFYQLEANDYSATRRMVILK